MELRDSRRLTGPNFLGPRPGVVLDLALAPGEDAEALRAAWRDHAKGILAELGWGATPLLWRRFEGGLSLGFEAPVDALYAATEVNEWALEAALAQLRGEAQGARQEAVERLRQEIRDEENPPLLALQKAAAERGVTFLSDDERASVGLGEGSLNWNVRELPDPASIPWPKVHDIPVALVTGTNGKTTTVRLLAAMVRAAGKVPGFSSTEGIWAGQEELERGDYAGPGGGRQVLRHPQVQVALLETARGGMLRRGLAVPRAEVAAITNVGEDHLGEWGVDDLAELADTKFIVARAARHLVLNHDDEELRKRGESSPLPVLWFRLQEGGPELGPDSCRWQEGDLVLRRDGQDVLRVAESQVPITLGGAARFNVANALAAMGVASVLGLPPAAIRQGLETFEGGAGQNPGRLNRFELGGVTALVDFAHNPHGMNALMTTALALPARRRLVVLGQAGDRDDEALRALARTVWAGQPDRVILKELSSDLRGRQAGEVNAILADELRRQGAPDSALAWADSELAAVHQALEWARAGDLLLLLSHTDRPAVLQLLDDLQHRGWQPGDAL
jgi:UDP-N-acetylmuramyl tripeptide synthase